MNKIYWDKDKISILTDQLDAVPHKHWMMQLFLSLEGNLEICVADKNISCQCIIVDKNVSHSFSANNKLHLSIIIEPASDIAGQLSKKMNGEGYAIFSSPDISHVRKLALDLIETKDITPYTKFIDGLFHFLSVEKHPKVFDNRIEELLQLINECTCDAHSISLFADKAALSASRLSHLFQEQVGIPLKSYILLHQMEKAFTALLNGNNITDAAMLAGFDTPSHFAAVTKRMMGMSASLSLQHSEFLKVY